jgi:hypothetical protein
MTLPSVGAILNSALASVTPVPVVYRTEAKEGAVPPYVVWSTVSGLPENNLETPETDNARIQIDFYAPQDAQALAKEMCDLGMPAVERVADVIFGPVETRDPESKFWRWMIHASFWTNR